MCKSFILKFLRRQDFEKEEENEPRGRQIESSTLRQHIPLLLPSTLPHAHQSAAARTLPPAGLAAGTSALLVPQASVLLPFHC